MITTVDEMLDAFAHFLSDAMVAQGLTLTDIDAIITTAKERVQGEVGESASAAPADDAWSDLSLENGIFNLVVHLVHQHEMTMSALDARERVIVYLEKLVAGLRSFDQKVPTP